MEVGLGPNEGCSAEGKNKCVHPGSHGNQTLLQMDITAISLGHPIRRILDCAISFFGGLLKTAFMYHHYPRPFINFAIR
jgi:hypothetical protein